MTKVDPWEEPGKEHWRAKSAETGQMGEPEIANNLTLAL
jgi:hypothetical protein